MLLLTRRSDLMGDALVNRRATTLAAAACTVIILVLNLFLIVEAVTGQS
jgi:Mn2+/Fe2+ NRAMP family transporter